MKLAQINLGGITLPNNVFLAPLAGYTNAVFRELCYNLGAGLTYTEMVSAKGLCYGSEKTADLLYVTPTYKGVKACQIFGNEAVYMRRACESQALAPFDIVDINMGCPVPKIYKNGEGCALLNDLKKASRIISECKKSGKIITVKFRVGIDKTQYIASEFAAMCEQSGADLITVHGRTRENIYSGEVNYKEIAAAKHAVKIPVIANGGVITPTDADVLLSKTGADGVMIARGALYNPWIFSAMTGRPAGDKRETVRKQIQDTRREFGERFACVYMRKLVGYYLKGEKGASAIRSQLLKCKTCDEVLSIVDIIEFH